jgi:ABC-2 type transport system permease protein
MRNVWTIARRELRVYFSSPIGYIVLAMFAVMFGWFFASSLIIFAQVSAQAAMQPGVEGINVNQYVVQPTLGNCTIMLLLTMPLITMRLFAEEQKQGTIELLLTSPIGDYEIILGKWLGGMLLFGCMLLISLLNFAVLLFYAPLDWRAMIVAYLGLLLWGGAMMALGGFISTTTTNQIVAGSISFGLFLLLFVLVWAQSYSQSALGQLAGYISMPPHFEQFSKGVIELKDATYYLTAIGLGLFLSKRSLESVRWKA